MLKAVILDFGGVVFKDKPKEDWLGTKNRLDIDENLWSRAVKGEIEDSLVFEEAAKNYDVDANTIKQWLFSRRIPNQELLDLLSNLRPGIKKAVLNNGLKSLFYGFFQKYSGIADKFDLLVNSAEEKVLKPDPRIYQITCEKLSIDPEECVFIDDNELNIKGAEELAMKGIFFKGVEDLKQKLKDLDLIVAS